MQIACMVLFAGVDYFVNLVYIGPTLNLTMCPCITFLWWNVCCLWQIANDVLCVERPSVCA